VYRSAHPPTKTEAIAPNAIERLFEITVRND